MPRSRQRLLWVGLLICTVVVTSMWLVGGVSGSPTAATKTGTITIGIVNPYSGPAAFYGQVLSAAWDSSAELIKEQGGIKVGDTVYQLRSKGYDNKLDPTETIKVFQRAVLQDNVRIIDLCCGVAPAVLPLSNSKKVLLFNNDAYAGHYLGKKYPFSFLHYYDPGNSVKATLTYIRKSRPTVKRIASLDPTGVTGAQLAAADKANIKKLGFQLVDLEIVDPSVADFVPVMTKILTKKPEIISTGYLPPGQWPLAVVAARNLGFKGDFIFPDQLLPELIKKVVKPAMLEGSYTSPHFEPTKVNKRFLGLVSKRLGFPADPYIEIWHDDAMLLKKAIEDAQSLDTEKIAKSLDRVSIRGLLGPNVRFRGHALQVPIVVGRIGKNYHVTSVFTDATS